jgi:transposase, IS5 family
VIERRRAQRSFGDGLIADEVKDLREGWMNHADRLLDDEAIIAAVYEVLGRRHPKSRSRGRLGAGRCGLALARSQAPAQLELRGS